MKSKPYLNIQIIASFSIVILLSSCQGVKPSSSQATPNNISSVLVTQTRQHSPTKTYSIKPTTTRRITTPMPTITPIASPTLYELNEIAFTGTGEDRYNDEIYLVYPNSLRLVNLTQNPAADFMPAWSPDGSRIAFISSRNNQSLQIYVMNADGSEVQQITNSDLIPLHRPSWSPDGKRIVFDAQNPDGTDGIFIVDLDNREITNLINDQSHNLDPDWSPDGTQIAFSSDRDGLNEYDFDIYTLDLSTNNVHRLTKELAREAQPDWSPDGSQIAFSRFSENRAPYICIINPDGSNLKELLSVNTEEGGTSAAWSGDGTRIAFQDLRAIENGPILDWLNSVFIDSIYVMNSDGTSTVRLTFGDVLAQYPDWRP
jgi:TolB protein